MSPDRRSSTFPLSVVDTQPTHVGVQFDIQDYGARHRHMRNVEEIVRVAKMLIR